MDSANNLSLERQEILNSLGGRIEPVATSVLYRLGLLIVAAAMIALPLIYAVLVATLGYGVYWHAVYNLDLFEQLRPRAAFLSYVAPLVVGAILVFFMVKPFFAPQAKAGSPLPLRRRDHPLLFAFVDNLCRVVGSPSPSEIAVDCQVNASAGFRRGMRSFFKNDLILVIGLPLVNGLTLRQFSGVLAHEFGHFSQQAGMRLSYIIRTVSHWFTRVVYQRDRWDEELESWSNRAGGWSSLVLLLARLFVWLTRKVLWILMWIGHVISCFLLRQMEFDADRHEARLAGSSTFVATAVRLRELAWAYQTALESMGQNWNEGWLVDDIPQLVKSQHGRLDLQDQRLIEEMASRAETGWLDTHPSDKDRISSARREGADGLFDSSEQTAADLPAAVLFEDFEKLSQLVTKRLYRDQWLLDLERVELRPLKRLLQQQEQVSLGEEALDRFFLGHFPEVRRLPLGSSPLTPKELGTGLSDLQECRRRQLEHSEDRPALLAQLEKVRAARSNAGAARILLRAGFRINARDFELGKGSLEEAMEKEEWAESTLRELDPRLKPFEESAAKRLVLALRLLQNPELAERLEGGNELAERSGLLLRIGRRTSQLAPALDEFTDLFQGLLDLTVNLEGRAGDEELINVLQSRMRRVHSEMSGLVNQFDGLPYPFESASRNANLRFYLLPDSPMEDDLEGLITAARTFQDRYYHLHRRLFSELALVAERVEKALGLPPLAGDESPRVHQGTAVSPPSWESPGTSPQPSC